MISGSPCLGRQSLPVHSEPVMKNRGLPQAYMPEPGRVLGALWLAARGGWISKAHGALGLGLRF